MSVGQKLVHPTEYGPCYLGRSIYESRYLIEELDYTIHCTSGSKEGERERGI
jgi:hypothetical protein